MALLSEEANDVLLVYPTPVMVRIIPDTAATNRGLREVLFTVVGKVEPQ